MLLTESVQESPSPFLPLVTAQTFHAGATTVNIALLKPSIREAFPPPRGPDAVFQGPWACRLLGNLMNAFAASSAEQ